MTNQQYQGNASPGEGGSSQPRETVLTLRVKVVSKGKDIITTAHDPDVHTTPAPASDFDMITPIQETLARRDVVPAQQIVEKGYMSGQNIAESAARGVDLIGPVRPDGSKQAHIDGGVTLRQFNIDYNQQRAHQRQVASER